VRRLREEASGRSFGLTAERARHAAAQANKLEMDLAEARGELVRVDDVLTTWAGHIGTVRQALLGLPSKAAGMIAPAGKTAQAEATLRRLIKETLVELASDGRPRKRKGNARRGGQDVEPATRSHRKRVG